MAARANEMAAAYLTEDLILDILSRLPIKSLRRFKCVSRLWRDLITYSDVFRKLPQTLDGFFYSSDGMEYFPASVLHFTNISGRGPLAYLGFLPSHLSIKLLDCCNGLLLCRCRWEAKEGYIVCNPATKKWVGFPLSRQSRYEGIVRLGFDPAVSPHFHVFELLEEEFFGVVIGMEVYSSATATWVFMENGWTEDITLGDRLTPAVFLNGCLHLHTWDDGGFSSLGVVDTEGATWTNFQVPGSIVCDFIQLSQGRLHYACFHNDDGVVRLQVYVLEDYDSHEWILKHSIESLYVFGEIKVEFTGDFDWIAIHPECNLIFFTAGWDITFMSYNMDTSRFKCSVTICQVMCHICHMCHCIWSYQLCKSDINMRLLPL